MKDAQKSRVNFSLKKIQFSKKNVKKFKICSKNQKRATTKKKTEKNQI